MADRAANCGTKQAVVPGDMAGNAASHRAGHAARLPDPTCASARDAVACLGAAVLMRENGVARQRR